MLALLTIVVLSVSLDDQQRLSRLTAKVDGAPAEFPIAVTAESSPDLVTWTDEFPGARAILTAPGVHQFNCDRGRHRGDLTRFYRVRATTP